MNVNLNTRELSILYRSLNEQQGRLSYHLKSTESKIPAQREICLLDELASKLGLFNFEPEQLDLNISRSHNKFTPYYGGTLSVELRNKVGWLVERGPFKVHLTDQELDLLSSYHVCRWLRLELDGSHCLSEAFYQQCTDDYPLAFALTEIPPH